MRNAINTDEYIDVRIEKSQARFTRIKNPKGADRGEGHYFLLLEMVAKSTDVFVPLSIASGKKSTGFVYQIEGTGDSSLFTTAIEAKGEGVSTVTIGTLQYMQIPKGKTASFRIQVDIKGKIGKTYTVIIHNVHYKLSVTDARYKKFVDEVRTKALKFV